VLLNTRLRSGVKYEIQFFFFINKFDLIEIKEKNTKYLTQTRSVFEFSTL